MVLSTSLPAILLDTLLGRLALLFLTGANGDLAAARQAASSMLAAYDPQTEDELRLAAEIISFSLHALEALSQANAPDMAITKILRLRSSAVSLSREAHKSQRKLDQLQTMRRAGIAAEQPAAAPQPTTVRPAIDKAIALIEATRQMAGAAGTTSRQTWTQAYQQRQTAKRIAENLKKNQTSNPIPVATALDETPDAVPTPRP